MVKYGAEWMEGTTDLEIEMGCIKMGGQWKSPKSGATCGLGRSYHLEQMRRIIWPELDHEDNGQRWHGVCRDAIANHKFKVLMGPGSSGKTHEGSWYVLCMYWVRPDETCVLVSSTDVPGLRRRVWAEISMLWKRGIERFPNLAGNMLDSKIAITTDKLRDGDLNSRSVRDMRKAIVGIPTVQNGKQIGLGKWVGIKQTYVFLLADEAQFMGPSFLSAVANLNNNANFEAIILGNPNDTLDPLGRAAEPADGWDGHMEPKKTETWPTRFLGGICVNLVGTDSPNFDFPEDEPTRFTYLISRQKITETTSFFPKDGPEYYSQCVGVMKISSMAKRVLTRKMADDGQAMEKDVIWATTNRTKIFFVDAGYGGDRCVGGGAEFGATTDGKIVLLLYEPEIVPISVSEKSEAEEQIAKWIKEKCIALGIPPENMGHDATGRGSLGTFIARAWSALTHPVEAGGRPTDRPVSKDLYVYDDKENKNPNDTSARKRLKKCSEHYKKRVTEYWFSVRYTVQASQLRGLSSETLDEFCKRQWDMTAGNLIELETKEEMKKRVGQSPDLADWCAGILEMARRKGFMISSLATEPEPQGTELDWLIELSQKRAKAEKSKQLNYAA